MCGVILSEGFWACIGAIIGATIGGIITYIVSKRAVSFEIQKENIKSLDFKIRNLMILKGRTKLYTTELDVKADEVHDLIQAIFGIDYMFNRAKLNELFKSFEQYDWENDERRNSDIDNSVSEICPFYLYKEAIRIITEELDQTNKEKKDLLRKII